MSYRDTLPDGCPPQSASAFQEPTDMYRLVQGVSPSTNDFLSWRTINPKKQVPPNITECQAFGLSVLGTKEAAKKQSLLPRFKKSQICKVKLSQNAGPVLQTGNPPHHTWWPLAAFDILANCEVVSA